MWWYNLNQGLANYSHLPHLAFCMTPKGKNRFYTFKCLKINQRKIIILWYVWMIWSSNFWSVNKVLLRYSYNQHVHAFYDCFLSTTIELSKTVHPMSWKSERFHYLDFYTNNFLIPATKVHWMCNRFSLTRNAW